MTETVTSTDRPTTEEAWRGFVAGPWQDGVDVRDFIQRNYTPYTGDAGFLAGPTDRTTALWEKLAAMFPAERERGVYDVDTHTPGTITSHAPGYIDKDSELIVGLQTDAPLKRAMMPNGGWRMVENGARDLRLRGRPDRRKIFTTYRKTHNDGVFDVYTRGHGRAPVEHHHRPARRLRPRPDHRRLPPRRPLRGRCADRGQEARARRAGPAPVQRRRHPRSRGERRAGPRPARAQGDGRLLRLRHLPARRHRRARPCSGCTSRYLGAVKEQNGAAMSLGRTSTFLDVYFQRDLDAGLLTEQEAQEIVDDLVIKLRIVRFLRTPRVRRAVLRRPDVGDRVDRRHRRGRAHARHALVVPVPADPLQPRVGPGAEPDGAVERPPARGLQEVLRAGVDRHLGDPVRVRRPPARPVR